MDTLHGTWLHETSYEGMQMQTYQTIQPNGHYETRIHYTMPDGCHQLICHVGNYNLLGNILKLMLETGTTTISSCPDNANNFAERPFTDAELAETIAMLSQLIQIDVQGDTLTTIVRGPAGEMRVTYQRQP
jgi:hypothetical protein